MSLVHFKIAYTLNDYTSVLECFATYYYLLFAVDSFFPCFRAVLKQEKHFLRMRFYAYFTSNNYIAVEQVSFHFKLFSKSNYYISYQLFNYCSTFFSTCSIYGVFFCRTSLMDVNATRKIL